MTTTVKDKLRLPSERTQTISVKTLAQLEKTLKVWVLFTRVSVLSMEMTCSCQNLLCHSSAILYTAIQTKLGWVLSGPTNGAVQNDQQQNNLVPTHVLKTAAKPADITNESLDGSL